MGQQGWKKVPDFSLSSRVPVLFNFSEITIFSDPTDHLTKLGEDHGDHGKRKGSCFRLEKLSEKATCGPWIFACQLSCFKNLFIIPSHSKQVCFVARLQRLVHIFLIFPRFHPPFSTPPTLQAATPFSKLKLTKVHGIDLIAQGRWLNFENQVGSRVLTDHHCAVLCQHPCQSSSCDGSSIGI